MAALRKMFQMCKLACVSEPGLFDLPEGAYVPPEEKPKETPGQIRRRRQNAAAARGSHPLSVALRNHIPLHADTGHARSYPKCAVQDSRGKYPRVTNGPGTDVLARWPACLNHQHHEEGSK